MTDILDHLQPDSPLYEATRDAAGEEITSLRSLNKELAEALLGALPFLENLEQNVGVPFGRAVCARAALTKYRGKE